MTSASPPTPVKPLRPANAWNDTRRAGVLEFLRALGCRPAGVTEAELQGLFRLLSRAEEWDSPIRHEGHGRKSSLASPARCEQTLAPQIDRWVAAWWKEGRLLPSADGAGEGAPRWPHGRRFALCLTHDIDILQEYLWRERLRHLRHLAGAPPRRRALLFGSLAAQIVRRIGFRRGRASPPLDAWLQEEDRFGFRSTCHFFADPLPHATWQDKFYRYDDRIDYGGARCAIGEVIRKVSDAGWDVGLHGSLPSHASAELLRMERRALEAVAGRPVVSTRQHHLAWDVLRTPAAHAAAGLRIDSSVGSNTDIGFRCGTGLPFRMFDPGTDQPLDLLQMPLIVQDNPLAQLSAGCEDLMVQRGVELIDRVAEHGGAITLLWHNQHRPDSTAFRCYTRLLAEAAAREAWGCSMRQINDWWRPRLNP